MEDWVTIQHVKKHNPNLGTRELAKILHLSRNTVKKALAHTEPPEYKREKKVNPSMSVSTERKTKTVTLTASGRWRWQFTLLRVPHKPAAASFPPAAALEESC